MTKLILKFKDRVIKEFEVAEDPINIGRDQVNDIVIDNIGISRNHAKIELQGKKYVLTDLNSTNGTFVNKKKIKQTILKDKDEIIIGKHMIFFISEEDQPKEKSNFENFESTVILNTAQQRELLAKQQKKSRTFSDKHAKLIVIDSSKRKEYKLTKEVTVIGKSPTSDVEIKGFLVPQMAATIKKEGNSYYITGYGGWINVNVNGKVAGKSWKLYPNDIIKIRKVEIIFQQS